MKRKHVPKRGWNDLDSLEEGGLTRLQTDQQIQIKNQDQIARHFQELTKETVEKVGMGGSLGQVNAGGVVVGPGLGVSAFEGGILKSTIETDGDVFFGSDISTPSGVSFATFVNEQYYNAELMEAGDLLIGDNSAGVSNVKYDASEGQLQFRFGTTVKAYMDTDGSLKVAEGLMSFDNEGISFYSQGVAMQLGATEATTIDKARTGWFVGGLQKGSTVFFGIHQFSRNGAVLIDDGFESGLTGWTLTGTPVQSTDHKTGGSYSCRINSTNYITKTISVTAGSYYLLSFKIRKTSATNVPRVFGDWLNNVPTDAWTLILYLYAATSTGNVDLIFTALNTDYVYLDDVYMYPCNSAFSFFGDTFDGGGSFQIWSADNVWLQPARQDGGGRIVLNPQGYDVDTRIAGDTDNNLLYVDAGLDAIGMGGAAESGYKLKVHGKVNLTTGNTYDINGSPHTHNGQNARVYHNTTQAVNTSTHTALTFNSERYDTDTVHDTSTNPTRLTCKTPGKYDIKGAVSFPDNATGVRMAYIRLNGTKILGVAEFMAVTTPSVATACTLAGSWDMALNDYVELVVWQNSGSTLTFTASDAYQAEFSMERVG